MKLNDDYLLACRDSNFKLYVYCLKERVLLYSPDGADGIRFKSICYSEQLQTLFALTTERKIIKFSLQIRARSKSQMNKGMMGGLQMSMEEFNNNNLKFLMQRYWLQNAEEDCLKNIK